MPKKKKILFVVWLLLIAVAVSFYFLFPEYFTVSAIQTGLQNYQGPLLLGYLGISLVRGIFFIPSTPFVLAGAIIFPNQAWMVVFISICGVLAGSTYVYFFTEYLEVEKVFRKNFKARFEKVKKGMTKYGLWIVVAWAFIPVVPTDLISYTAGVTKMPYWKFAIGILLGELPLVMLYVFFGG
ncbi:MAG TPA: TVP38/TMEM64 family protein, partial [Bacteroidetes bacterium]|nr:TVP38/TMEM64 family protein [Bacteroidota bacterium]